MPEKHCEDEKRRMDDKYTLFQNATADVQSAIIIADAADIAFEVACLGAIASVGFGAPSCATAAVALATAIANVENATEKMENAQDAYLTAADDYIDCYSRLAEKAIEDADRALGQ